MTTPPPQMPSEACYTPDNSPRYPPTTPPAQRLQQARQRLRWSRQGLADLLGLKHATIFRYETGTRTPEQELVLWLEALATDLETALHRLPPPPHPR
jgi:DNA-binding XRE family transcriptional regulator